MITSVWRKNRRWKGKETEGQRQHSAGPRERGQRGGGNKTRQEGKGGTLEVQGRAWGRGQRASSRRRAVGGRYLEKKEAGGRK